MQRDPLVGGRSAAELPLLRVYGLSKSFPGLKALDDVSLEVHAGEIVAVVGHNGSGKSTLVKVLAGVYPPDPGASVEVHGTGDRLLGADDAQLHFIHQDLGLVETMSTVENLELARPPRRRDLLPFRTASEQRRALTLIGRFGASFDPSAPVASLSPAERAIVAIARALDGWTRSDNVLVLDEPTTAFHADEVEILFEAVRRVASAGAGVIFISHRLDEILGLADRVVALRDGRVVANQPSNELDHDHVVELIAGRAVAEFDATRQSNGAVTILEVEGLQGGKIHDFGLTLNAGEIVGVSGILGSGREQIASLVFGALRRSGGAVTVKGRELPPADIAASIEAGVGFLPADRRRHGAVMDFSVRENLTLARLRPLQRRLGRLDQGAERAETKRWTERVALRPADPERSFKLLSGGNQQKVLLAKWLRIRPTVLLLDEPTQGVDVGATSAIYELILDAAKSGTGVLVCSSDIKELVALCDRVLVIESGRLAEAIPRESLSEVRLARAELGQQHGRHTAGRPFDGTKELEVD